MRRAYSVLIGGAALFTAGVALTIVLALPIVKQLQNDTSILHEVPLSQGKSASVSFRVTDLERTLAVFVSAKDSGKMTAVLTAPSGNEILNRRFNETLIDNAIPRATGNYSLVVTNNSSKDTSINVVLGYLPGVGQNKAAVGVFSGVIAGVAIIFSGIAVMIGGVIILVIDRQRR